MRKVIELVHYQKQEPKTYTGVIMEFKVFDYSDSGSPTLKLNFDNERDFYCPARWDYIVILLHAMELGIPIKVNATPFENAMFPDPNALEIKNLEPA